MIDFEKLSKKELLKILDTYAKAWQAMDSCYFLALEEKYGIDVAIEMDIAAWKRFSPIEANRIMREFRIAQNSGLEGLKKALQYRVYARLNKQTIEDVDDNRFIFRMNECRVQVARKRKGLPDFPCKPVGIVEYTEFARTIDPRITTRCIACPPDPHPEEYWCAWEFAIELD
ncbi:MAG: DUF6125 family protein [Promethearchaeota archaeon]